MDRLRARQSIVVLATAAALVTTVGPIAAAAQQYKSPTFNSCIRQFYDPQMYNWLSFQNDCSQSLAVTYIAVNSPYGGYSADLAPGRKASTGFTRDEVRQRGGFELFVCPSGYLPVDARDRYVSRPNTQFRCKQR